MNKTWNILFVLALVLLIIFFIVVLLKNCSSSNVVKKNNRDNSLDSLDRQVINPLKGVYSAKNDIDNSNILWEESDFTINNFPGLEFDVDEKKEIFEMAKLLKPNYAVIDVGAHIGDLAIQLAIALRNAGREDVSVYAIDPSKNKCEFMEKIIHLNKVKNIIVINVGLSDKESYYGPTFKEKDKNTGGTEWYEKITEGAIKFKTLDSLNLNKKIGIYHIDVENLELEALQGSIQTLKNSKPILCIESFIGKKNGGQKVQKFEDNPDLFLFLKKFGYISSGLMKNGDIIFT